MGKQLLSRFLLNSTITAIALLLLSLVVISQPAAPKYTITQSMIPMRDGVRLNTQVFMPTRSDEKFPFLMIRTPYGIGNLTSEQLAAAMRELTEDGYIVVQQDIRGRFKSEGQFVMLRQPRDPKDKKAIDESTDTYDTIEWLLKNVPNNNGRVGIAGTSYGAWLSVMAMLDPHPALKAVVEQASPADMFLGDDFHHNGAFRLSYGLEYTYMMESSKEVSDVTKLVDQPDAYDWYLKLGALSNADSQYFNGKLPTWNDFVNHPDYDAFWKRQGFAPWLNRVNVPILNVAGWWDQEDFYGPMKIYQLLEKHDTAHENFLVVGPWNHGGWSRSDGSKLGPVDFGSKTSEYYRRNVQAQFLAYHLKGKPDPGLPEALTFRTGVNQWTRHDEWPPKQNVAVKNLYFQANGGLSFDQPPKASEPASDTYISDPADPVPYRHRPIQVRSGWTTWLVEDQRFVDHRPDVLTYVSEPLKEDLTISGTVTANLFASTSGTDSDWVVKVIDVYPENYAPDPKMAGYELMIADDVFRGRYYKSFDKPNALVPNAITHYTIGFPGNDHTFLTGHRVMVQVQSTWFPLIDRNPQKFVPNIFKATEADFQKATQRVYRSGGNASFIQLPIVINAH